MEKTNTGGPAFPGKRFIDVPFVRKGEGITESGFRREEVLDGGMTLRDYFAAKAMASFIAATASNDAIDPEIAMSSVSRMAFMMADAMIAARGE